MAKKDPSQDLLLANAANSKIEAIKNLIFGENIEAYNNEFEALKADIEKKRNEMLDYIDDARKEIMTAVDNISTDVNIRISDLEQGLDEKVENLDNSSMSREDLGEALIALGKNIKV